jgi:hypothetical protein
MFTAEKQKTRQWKDFVGSSLHHMCYRGLDYLREWELLIANGESFADYIPVQTNMLRLQLRDGRKANSYHHFIYGGKFKLGSARPGYGLISSHLTRYHGSSTLMDILLPTSKGSERQE